MAIAEDIIQEAVARYGRERDRYLKLAARIADIARTEIVEANAIRAQVTSRTKSTRSFEGKLRRFARNPGKSFDSVDAVFERVGDFAGVRVATYSPEDQGRVEELVCRVFNGNGVEVVVPDRKDAIDPKAARFYRATHCQVCLPEADLVGEYENLRGTSCEIQVCSMMAHVWNEIEHDIAYKPEGSGPGAVEKGLLGALGHLTCSGDATITRLLEATEARLAEQTGDFVDIHDFVARLRKVFPGVELSVNAGVAFDVARILGLTNPGLVMRALGGSPPTTEAARERVRLFNEHLDAIGAAELRLNPGSADVLTAVLLETAADRVAEHFEGRIAGRLPRAALVAKRYREFLEGSLPGPETRSAA